MKKAVAAALVVAFLGGGMAYGQQNMVPAMMTHSKATPVPPGQIAFSPTSLSFSTAPGTASSPQTVTATNSGGSTFNISSISITGTNPGDFSQTNTCGATLAKGASCNISVTFNRSTAGTSTANLAVTGS